MRFLQPLQRVYMSDQGRPRAAHVRIVIGVVPMPVRVDREFHRGVSETIEGFLETVPRKLREGIHKQLAVRAVQHNDVSARPPQQSEVLRELRRLDWNFPEPGPSCRKSVGRCRTTLLREARRRARESFGE